MATEPVVQLPVDYNGTAPSNRIRGEKYILNLSDSRDHRVIIPKLAPFYANQENETQKLSLYITDPDTNNVTTLIEGKHYYPVFYFIQASKATARPLYGGIEIIDDTLKGIVTIDYYQSLGGIWNITTNKIAQILAELKYNPRIRSWDSVADLPERFPVVDHEWDLVDMAGPGDLVLALYAIRDQMASESAGGLTAHINNKNNPHGVTAALLGLGNVKNYGLATVVQARAGTINTAYMTPSLTKEAIAEQALTVFDAHARTINAHGVTPAVIGAPTLAEHNTKLDKTGTAANSTRFAGNTFAEAGVEILKGTAANSDRLGGLTLDEIRGEVGTIENAEKLSGRTLEEILGMVPDYVNENYTSVAHATDADKLEGNTLTQVLEAAARLTVDNSLKFNGQTPAQFKTSIFNDLGNNLTAIVTPKVNELGVVSINRMFFNGNRYFPIYRFNLDALLQNDLPTPFNGSYTHSFIVTPFDNPGNDFGSFIVTLNHKFTWDWASGTPTGEIGTFSGSVQSLNGKPIELKLYARAIGTKTLEIMIDKIAKVESADRTLTGFSAVNLSAYSKFLCVKNTFLDESQPTVTIGQYQLLPMSATQAPPPAPITTRLQAGQSYTSALIKLGTPYQVLVKKVSDSAYSSAESVIEVAISTVNAKFTNLFTEALDVHITYTP